MGIGLWLAAPAVEQLLAARRVPELADFLADCGLVPWTFNGFPQGDFHEQVVKHRVYQPAWWEDDRRQYTLDLITVLDGLLPAGWEGSISTLPIGWGSPRPSHEQMRRAAYNLVQIVDRLTRLEADTGRLIYVCLEPEPGCVLQCSADVVRFFEELRRPSSRWPDIQRHVRVCHDICHSAVMFEEQQEVLKRYADHGIHVGKIQVSSAVRVDFDTLEHADRQEARRALESFAEGRYLHQTCIRSERAESPRFLEDLSQALELATSGQWRIHFHVPIYVERFGPLQTTQDDIGTCLHAVRSSPGVRQFEVETYAWGVLPQAMQRTDLADGIADELRWFADRARSAGLGIAE